MIMNEGLRKTKIKDYEEARFPDRELKPGNYNKNHRL
jgi:hypothetical protein